MGWFFTKAELMTFGGAYAVLPYVFQGAVEHHQWLSAAQMIDGRRWAKLRPGARADLFYRNESAVHANPAQVDMPCLAQKYRECPF